MCVWKLNTTTTANNHNNNTMDWMLWLQVMTVVWAKVCQCCRQLIQNSYENAQNCLHVFVTFVGLKKWRREGYTPRQVEAHEWHFIHRALQCCVTWQSTCSWPMLIHQHSKWKSVEWVPRPLINGFLCKYFFLLLSRRRWQGKGMSSCNNYWRCSKKW